MQICLEHLKNRCSQALALALALALFFCLFSPLGASPHQGRKKADKQIRDLFQDQFSSFLILDLDIDFQKVLTRIWILKIFKIGLLG